jgi:chorismate synthase
LSSTFGNYLRVTTFGESHGGAAGAIVDGFPANIPLTAGDIQIQLDRRRPGQSSITTQRDETDTVEILSGVDNGRTLGTPIALIVKNKDQRPSDYASTNNIPRPSHADYTYMMKYGITAQSGGGRASARETIGRVAAGAAAEIFLREKFGVEIVAFVSATGNISIDTNSNAIDINTITRSIVDQTPVRCPDTQTAKSMEELIRQVRDNGDSIGGIITCVCRNVPAGWGEPVFQKLEATLAQAMMSIPAAKGFELGAGFAGAKMRGSEHNDLFIRQHTHTRRGELCSPALTTKTNNSGGIQGGISNGEPIYFRVAFKPTATIGKEQITADYQGNETILKSAGRHDPCVTPRAVPVVESMAAIVLMNMALAQAASI